jgi:hypothetical protein
MTTAASTHDSDPWTRSGNDTDRPVDALTATEAALLAADAVEALIHATLDTTGHDGGGGYRDPADLDATVAALVTLVERLPQALRQASTWLRHQQTAGRVGHDQKHDVSAAVEVVLVDLERAGRAAAAVAHVLDEARQHTSHLTGPDPAPLTRPAGQSSPVGLSGGSCGVGDGSGGGPGVRPGVGLDTNPHTDPLTRTTGQVRNPTAHCGDGAGNPYRVSPQGNIPLSAPSRCSPADDPSASGQVSSARGGRSE